MAGVKENKIMSEIHTITFEVGNDTVQLCGETIMIWKGTPDHEPDVEMPIADLKNILSASSFLIVK